MRAVRFPHAPHHAKKKAHRLHLSSSTAARGPRRYISHCIKNVPALAKMGPSRVKIAVFFADSLQELLYTGHSALERVPRGGAHAYHERPRRVLPAA